mmetsp:Transcript_448/g.1109  ORF Transcript_448/g.1109 Transcript_448/m.1109 type:complete len:376 (-) Transcript_448:119-1246(-)|eukprot:CAMPEP_0168171438 /NCGR_PEP_ID=MMETSP0139_2-20121125/4705_1 /TAXON_ID=44445 /ORGANISM="Pseudo-nitzschia australis, Strain 10249 10 AB" /LENGTH=375 /DNA_ID=CAMNT_0008088991 /DNA_START=95 /DNA_END=1222 /DNA_ORIENTATION=-
MGNRTSSSVQPAGPPPLLSAAVVGDASRFHEFWMGGDSISVKDAQENNVLHALFSCRVENGKCSELLKCIHESLPVSRLKMAYRERNKIGCTPLWILVAYGNVALLKEVRQKFADGDLMNDFTEMLQQPNNQGDSPFLATCSQGNTDMVRFFLKEKILTPGQFNEALATSNKKGTTPLQIIVGNNHKTLLDFVLREGEVAVQKQLLESNTMGLSLFHICSERNAHEILQTIVTFIMDKESSNHKSSIDTLDQLLSLKDKNGANAIHVTAFCGNVEAMQVWIDVVKKACSDMDDNSQKSTTAAVLDKLDGRARTAYWLGMVQGRDKIGKLLEDEGVNIENPEMVREIEEAQEKRQKAAAARQQQNRTIDGSALLNR